MDNFDIICTATLRPELIKRTFDSHIKYLFKDHIKKARLIINVDMVGAKDPKLPEKELGKIFEYFDEIPFRDLTINVCYSPHFSRAFHWCVSQVKTPLVFNLEEDWELGMDIDFEKMVKLFEDDPKLMHLRLSMFESKKELAFNDAMVNIYEFKMKCWNKWIDYNGDYFSVPRNLRGVIGWAGHPGLNRSDFLLAFNEIINKERNHEKQIKGHRPILLNNHFGVFHPFESKAAIKDIGREWMITNGFQKKGIKAFFTEWCKDE